MHVKGCARVGDHVQQAEGATATLEFELEEGGGEILITERCSEKSKAMADALV